tara:strand:+ start:83 stop:217 length:135 start_codon:yes stop_codon:yes gene_type:complete
MEVAAEGNEEQKTGIEIGDNVANSQLEERYIVPTKNGQIDEIVV